jgi:ubiquinol-cytochrome c reductase cytochrome b subunit
MPEVAVLQHGIATGIIRRLPHGEFVEIHQPLAGTDEHGRPIPLTYQGAPVPKRMNQLNAGGRPSPGSLLTMDPAEQTTALEQARAEEAATEAANNGDTTGDAEQQHRTEQGEAPNGQTPDSRRSPSEGSGSSAQHDE